MKPYRVLVVEDQAIARSFLEQAVRSSGRYQLAASFDRADLAEVYCLRNPVDLILMDVMLSGEKTGLEVSAQIKKELPQIKIIIATSMPEYSWLEQAKQIGIEGFWYKEYGEQPLLSVLDRVAEGGTVYPDRTPVIPFGRITSADLTDRELEILKQMTGGYKNAEIAEHLFLSPDTVKKHIQNMLDKTGFRNRTELAVTARSSGLTIMK